MVPADSDDIRKEYEILLNELRTFNPEMLDKQRVLAVTKCDMLDQELMDEIEPTLPEGIPHIIHLCCLRHGHLYAERHPLGRAEQGK